MDRQRVAGLRGSYSHLSVKILSGVAEILVESSANRSVDGVEDMSSGVSIPS